MQKSDQKGYFPHTCFYGDDIYKAKKVQIWHIINYQIF